MSKFSILGASTALVLSLALASPTLAQSKFGGGGGGHVGGGGHMSMGGGHMGGGAHFSGGGHMGGASFAARPGGYAAMGGSKFGPRAAAATGSRAGAWNGGRTAWNGRGGHWRDGRWWPGAAAAGFAAGAALGSYAYYGGGPYYYGDDYYDGDYGPDYYETGVEVGVPAGGDAVAYCESRFRSYDPASGTYLGYDGLRHPCP